MVKVIKKNIGGIPHIGLIIKLFDDFAIVSNYVVDKDLDKMDIIKYTVSSEIVGPYILELDKNSIILSENSPEDLKNILKEHFDIISVRTRANLLGNLFQIGKNGFIYTRAYKGDVEIISDVTGLEPFQIKAPYLIPTLIKEYGDIALISQILPDKIIDKVISILKPKRYGLGSVNFGSPFVKYGIEINKDYLIIGENTTGHEIVNIEEIFEI